MHDCSGRGDAGVGGISVQLLEEAVIAHSAGSGGSVGLAVGDAGDTGVWRSSGHRLAGAAGGADSFSAEGSAISDGGDTDVRGSHVIGFAGTAGGADSFNSVNVTVCDVGDTSAGGGSSWLVESSLAGCAHGVAASCASGTVGTARHARCGRVALG